MMGMVGFIYWHLYIKILVNHSNQSRLLKTYKHPMLYYSVIFLVSG
jgi:hypothetical protein